MDIENTARSSTDRKLDNMEHVEDRTSAGSIRAPIASQLPMKEVMESHMDEDEERVKKIVRKVDIRLVGVLAILYVTAFLDRSNLGNAYIAGMGADLGLAVGHRYSLVAMIFFVGYILIDFPAAWLGKTVGISIWIPSIALGWGVLTIGQGFVKSWGGLLVCRLLLGICEGGFIPVAVYVLSVWYTRYEVHKRYAAFYVLGIASSGLSGLLAYGIEKMEGDAGIRGWSWIFILEGVATCAVALASYVLILDLPGRASRKNILGIPPALTAEEVAIMMARIDKDNGLADTEDFTIWKMLSELKDWKVWEYAALIMFNNVSLYAFSYFLPIILRQGLGYDVAKAQIMTFPPYAVGVVWVLFVAWLCDKLQVRGPAMIFNSTMYIVGIAMVGFAKNTNTRYAGVFLGVVGITGNVPTNFGYQQNNTVGQAKKAVAGALMTVGGGLAGIIAGNIFQAKDAPNYRPGLIIAICFQGLAILIPLKNFFIFTRLNRKADRGEVVLEGIPGFRYTL
ncbi:Fc.00g082860.m01.CDS01 [Cosmosporella sp. VM-42]